jgi:hypothetical protein
VKNLRAPEAIIALAVLVCFVAVALLDYSHRVRQSSTYDSFSTFDYQRGGYRAWFEMLHDEGIRVVRYEQRPAFLNDSIAVFIVANNVFDARLRAMLGQPYGIYTTADTQALERWIRNGGRLVWLVDQASALSHATSAKKGLRKLVATPAPSQPFGLPDVHSTGPLKDEATAVVAGPGGTTHRVLGTSRLRIPFGTDPSLSPLVADRAGVVVGLYPLGKGSVIVVTDESLFENGRLAQADNASLAYQIATFGLAPGQTVAFEEWSHGYQSGDSWWTILPKPFQAGFAIAACALVLLLLGQTWRFGPAIREPENTERTSFEYLTSVATLLERGQAARKAARDLAHLALRAAARAVGLPDSASAAAIGARFQGTASGERHARDLIRLERIAGFENPTDKELIEACEIALSLRKELVGDGIQRIAPRRTAARRSG